MKVNLFTLMGKMLDHPDSTTDEGIEIEIRKDWFKKKGFENFKLKFIDVSEGEK